MINEDMNIYDILDLSPEIEAIFLKHGLNCVGCPGSSAESLREAAAGHGINLACLMEEITNHLKTLE